MHFLIEILTQELYNCNSSCSEGTGNDNKLGDKLNSFASDFIVGIVQNEGININIEQETTLNTRGVNFIFGKVEVKVKVEKNIEVIPSETGVSFEHGINGFEGITASHTNKLIPGTDSSMTNSVSISNYGTKTGVSSEISNNNLSLKVSGESSFNKINVTSALSTNIDDNGGRVTIEARYETRPMDAIVMAAALMAKKEPSSEPIKVFVPSFRFAN